MSFTKWNEAQYTKRTSHYTGPKGAKEKFDWEEFMYNAVARYAQHGDPTHLNNVLKGAANVGRYRSSFRVIAACSAHGFNKKEKMFTGKANPKKMDNVRENWEIIFFEALMEENTHQNTTPTFDWSKKEGIVVRLVAAAIASGIDSNKIDSAVTKGKAEGYTKLKEKQQEAMAPVIPTDAVIVVPKEDVREVFGAAV